MNIQRSQPAGTSTLEAQPLGVSWPQTALQPHSPVRSSLVALPPPPMGVRMSPGSDVFTLRQAPEQPALPRPPIVSSLLSVHSTDIQESQSTSHPERLMLPSWRYQAGANNAITDVPGVKVGQVTIRTNEQDPNCPYHFRTGFTAILPHDGNLAKEALWGNAVVLNGNGETTGLGPLQDEGVLMSPILLGSTYTQPQMLEAVHEFYRQAYPGEFWARGLPVTGECYDAYQSDVANHHKIPLQAAVDAMLKAQGKPSGAPVEQGGVGAGTGMMTFRLHAGVGSASREVMLTDPKTGRAKAYHIGVLVNTNHSRPQHLNPDLRARLEQRLGRPIEDLIPAPFTPGHEASGGKQGSIQMVMATDIPLSPTQIKQVGKHSPLALGRVGSVMAQSSGDFFVGFSTANRFKYEDSADFIPMQALNPNELTTVYEAYIEALEEAQINAILASYTPKTVQNVPLAKPVS